MKNLLHHKVKIIEAYAGKIAKVHETLEAVEKGLLDIGSYCVCFEASKLLPWNFDYFLPFTSWYSSRPFPSNTTISFFIANLSAVFNASSRS